MPSEGDIRDLSPALADSLLLARSVRTLCIRHRSDLGVPLGQGIDAHGTIAGGAAGAGSGLGPRSPQLWINEQLAHVRMAGWWEEIGVRDPYVPRGGVVRDRLCRGKAAAAPGVVGPSRG